MWFGPWSACKQMFRSVENSFQAEEFQENLLFSVFTGKKLLFDVAFLLE